MTENDGSTKETSIEAGSSTPYIPRRPTEAETREKIKGVLVDAASKAGRTVDEDELASAVSGIFDSMKKISS